MSQTPEEIAREIDEEPPPFLKTWRRVYGFVVCYLFVLIACFYLFSRALAP